MANAPQLFQDDEDERLGSKPSDDELSHIIGINKKEEQNLEGNAQAGALEDLSKQEGSASDLSSLDSNSTATASSELAAAEATQADTSLGRGFTPIDKQSGAANATSWIIRNRRKALVGGGLTTGIAGIIITMFFLLIPLKIEHIVTNLQNRFFAPSENAMQNETQSLFTTYIEKHVLPGYTGKCGTTIDRHCTASALVGSNPVNNLYKAWSQARLENKIATDYGIEFQHRADGNWYLKAPGTKAEGDNIGSTGEKLGEEFQRADRTTMRNAVKNALQNETKLKQMYYRFKVGRLLEEKYGVRRCLMFCGTTDALAKHIKQQKNAAKIYIVQRVLIPRTKTLGIALVCLLNSCNPETTQPSTSEPGSTELELAPENPEVDTQVRNKLTELAANYGITDETAINKMLSDYKELSDKGYKGYVLDKVLEKLGLQEISSNATDALPVIGWVITGSKLITAASSAGPALKKLTYVTNSAAAVSMYMMYRTYADEIHTGHVNATEVGSIVNSLGPDSSNTTDKAGAEATPLYGALIDGTDSSAISTTTSIIGNFLPGKAFADPAIATTHSSGYRCKNGPVPAGKLICPEEAFGQSDTIASALHSFLVFPGINIITQIAGVINAIVNFGSAVASNIFNTVLGPLGFNDISKFVSSLLKPALSYAVNQLIVNPFSDTGGARNFDMMAGGADVAGHDACEQIGCSKVSPQTYNTIVALQESQRQQQFSTTSLLARMFDANSPYSLISKIAMDVPLNVWAASTTNFAAVISNPFGHLFSGLSALLSSKTSAASPALVNDPFGVTPVAFPTSYIPSDSESYWDQHQCGDTSTNGPVYKWQQAAATTTDPNNGMPIHNVPEPCLLIQAAVSSAGGWFDSSLLSQDDLGNQTQGASVSPSPPVGSTGNVSGTAQQLASQVLSNSNIQLSGSDVRQDIQAATNNQVGSAGAMTSGAILQLILTIGQDHKVTISAIQSGGIGHCNNQDQSICPNDPHYNGDAVDFSALDGAALTGRDSSSLFIMKTAFGILPSGSGFGQSQCGQTPTLPNGDTSFKDSCDHLHVQVPTGTP